MTYKVGTQFKFKKIVFSSNGKHTARTVAVKVKG